MRNSVVRLALAGFGQVLPAVMREFLGRVNWTIGSHRRISWEPRLPIAQTERLRAEIEGARLLKKRRVIRQERRIEDFDACKVNAIGSRVIDRTADFESLTKRFNLGNKSAKETRQDRQRRSRLLIARPTQADLVTQSVCNLDERQVRRIQIEAVSKNVTRQVAPLLLDEPLHRDAGVDNQVHC